MLIIKNGMVTDPASGFEGMADVWVEDGTIKKVIKRESGTELLSEAESPADAQEAANVQVIDAAGMVVAPGLMDVHVHFRDPGLTYKEDILTGAAAAARGGFTRVVCMANTSPVIDNVETLRYALEKGKTTGIHVMQAAAVTKGLAGRELTDMDALKAAGAAGFTDDGIPILDAKILFAAMEQVKRLNMPISLHEEDARLITNNGINQGEAAAKLGIVGSPSIAEESIVARDCMIALRTGARVNVQHISSAVSLELVRLAKSLGADVWAEVTPHHLTLTEDAVLKHGTLAKMNPPLRTEQDREALIAALADGTIDMVATDHAPHSKEEKERGLTGTPEYPAAPSGITGLETALSLCVTHLVRTGKLSMMQLMEKMSKKPAELYHTVYEGIREGAAADLVIFAPEETWVVGGYASKATNSPFTGEELYGKVRYTICEGKIVYQA
ncbi:MAG: dihydroorotase [bacterium]|nr:dihydroorotase [bacterium]